MLLSPKAKSDAIPSLIVEVDNVKASHGGTIGELDPEQIFYMMTRGISRAEAVRVLVEGYFEEVVMRLDDPGLEELVRRRISEKLARAEDQVLQTTQPGEALQLFAEAAPTLPAPAVAVAAPVVTSAHGRRERLRDEQCRRGRKSVV